MKRGQMKLSFGMIFSIILIIIFISFAFYAIQKFLGMQRVIQTGQFIDKLQDDINKRWKSPQSSEEITYSLPTKIQKVCFKDDEYENLFFISSEFTETRNIEYIDIEKITENENPFCIDNINGKVKITLKKDFGEELVMIE